MTKYQCCISGSNADFDTFAKARDYALAHGAHPEYLEPTNEIEYEWDLCGDYETIDCGSNALVISRQDEREQSRRASRV